MLNLLNSLKMINTRIWMHCAALITATLLVSWLQIKPYGVLFLILLVFWLYKTRCAASIKIIPPPELSDKIIDLYDKLLKLRKESPTIFCAIITSVLAVLAIIGHFLSGAYVVIFGLILSALVSTKYNFKILKVPNTERLTWVDLTNDHEVDEFLPEVNDSNLFVLQRASDEAIITQQNGGDEENKNDEIPPELLLPESIPEIDENSETSSDDELIPKLSSDEKLQSKKKQINESEDMSLEFKRGYFKKDSSISTSSSDDESLSKGLNFNDYTVVDGGRHLENQQKRNYEQQQQQSTAVISAAAGAAASILPNLMTGLMSSLNKSNDKQQMIATTSTSTTNRSSDKQQQHQQQQLLDTSDESDFEILNTEDLNNP